MAKLKSRVHKGDYLVITGRLPHGMKESFYAHSVRFFEARGVKTIVDTSGKALGEALKAIPWFFKVNLYELSEALGRTISQLNQVPSIVTKQLIQKGLVHGAVTDGPRGAILWRGNEFIKVDTQKTANQLVIGAGDGFLAGYLKGILAGKSFEDCAKWASASGATVASNGIEGFEPKEVVRQLKFVKVRNIG